KGKVDPLMGLKENVIIGNLIPAGTGLPMYRDVIVTATPPPGWEEEEAAEEEEVRVAAEEK
ncbi:MAG: hypothetical protein ABIH66_01645, partial [bacterium]